MQNYFLTHHKCASGWFNSINFDLFQGIGWHYGIVNTKDDFNEEFLNDYYSKNQYNLISYNNAHSKFISNYIKFRAIHIVRDPRDIIVSGYFSHKNSHPSWGKEFDLHKSKLNQFSLEDGLLLELDFSKQFLEPMDSWSLNNPNILTIKMEDITRNPKEYYLKILKWYGLEVVHGNSSYFQIKCDKLRLKLTRKLDFKTRLISPGQKIDEKRLDLILSKNSFDKKSKGRNKGKVNLKSHYRKGIKGDYKNYFTDKVQLKFEKLYGHLIKKYNY